MKRFWGGIGTVLFWLLWPGLVVYFRFGGLRSRVIVVHEGEVLLVLSWLGLKKYGLPGGGTKRHETTAVSALRELEEETGIVIMERSLKNIGLFTHNRFKLFYKARLFSVELSTKPELKLHKPEIMEAIWVKFEDLKSFSLDEDAIYALERYRPAEQARLL